VRKRLPFFRAGFGVVLLVALVYYFDLTEVVKKFALFDQRWVLLAAVLVVASTLISAVNLHLFMNQEGKLPFANFLPLYWISWAIGIVLPGQGGDIASIAAMLRRRGMAWQVSFARSLLDKLISLALMLAFAMAGMFTLVRVEWNSGRIGTAIAVGAALMAGGYWGRNLIVKYFNPTYHGWRGFVARTSTELVATIKGNPEKVLLNFFLTTVRIIITGLCYWSMFAALQYSDLDILKVIPMVAITSVVAYLPISFNGIGTVEITGVTVFSTLGMEPASILSAYLALRLLVICLAWLPAGIWLLTSTKNTD
jgi:uncharacterized membrane protein YbhN (UPF0104 family)